MDLTVKSTVAVMLFVMCGFPGMFCVSGVCEEKYNISDMVREENVVFICTKSSTQTFTETVYLDTARVPLHTVSRCLCTLTFETKKSNSVNIDFNVQGSANTNNRMEMTTKLGVGFSTDSGEEGGPITIKTSEQSHLLRFNIDKGDDTLKACLRISAKNAGTSAFQVECSQSSVDPGPSQESSGSGSAAIIGGAVGGAVVVILVVVLVIVLIVKRKNRSAKDNEDYYITENAMYNDTKSATNRQTTDYDNVDIEHNNTDSVAYSVVNKDKGNSNVAATSPQYQPENEYNHLHEVSTTFSTGNVYSSTGNELSSTGNEYSSTGSGYSSVGLQNDQSGNIYNHTSDEVDRKRNRNKVTDNVYD